MSRAGFGWKQITVAVIGTGNPPAGFWFSKRKAGLRFSPRADGCADRIVPEHYQQIHENTEAVDFSILSAAKSVPVIPIRCIFCWWSGRNRLWNFKEINAAHYNANKLLRGTHHDESIVSEVDCQRRDRGGL